MSEPVSAFAAYRASGVIKPKQKNKDPKKNNRNKNANGGGGGGGGKGPRGGMSSANNSPKNKKNNKNSVNNSPRAGTSEKSINDGGMGDTNEPKSPKNKAGNKANGNGSGNGGSPVAPKGKKGNKGPKAIAKANNSETNDELISGNPSNGNKNAKGLNKNAAKAKERGAKKSISQETAKKSSNEAMDDTETNDKTNLEEDPDVFTAEELKLLASKPSALSKAERIRRAEIESKYLTYIDDEEVDDDNNSEVSEESDSEASFIEEEDRDEEGEELEETNEDDAMISGNQANRNKNAKSLNKKAAKNLKAQKTSTSQETTTNESNKAEEDPDVFTAEELKLLASKPSALSKEERIRRAELESNYLKYIDDDDVNEDETMEAIGDTSNGNKKAAKVKGQKKSTETNAEANSEEDPDVFTAEELKILASKPSALSKEERIRRAEMESNYLKYIDVDDGRDNNDDSELSAESDAESYLTEDEAQDGEGEERDDGNEIENEEGKLDINSTEEETSDEEYTGDEEDDESISGDSDLTEYTLDSESIEEEVLDDLVFIGQQNEQIDNPVTNAIATRSPGQKRKSEAILTIPEPKQAKTSSASPSEKSDNIVKQVISNIKLEPLSPPSMSTKFNSIEDGKKVLQWLINPFIVEDFFNKYWERSPCLIKRTQKDYFKHLISFEKIGEMLLKNHIEFTKHIDITKYKNGKRETLNPEGRALPPIVWEFYQKGCSVRLLNPQCFLPQIYSVCTRLQEYFSCFVGVNAYLTPAGTQGFAPHYDDIEAFVVQVEGQKRWRLYQPRKPTEYLPRFSSENFKQSEIGEPIFEQVLQPGDVLYFPRGIIHQAVTEKDHHSLHLTFSVYQKNSYADLFEELVPSMVNKAITNCLDFRKGLPLNLWRNTGIAYSDTESEERAKFQEHVRKMLKKMITSVPLDQLIDQAVDQLAKRFQNEALPPEILHHEKNRTIFGSENCKDDSGAWVPDYVINIRTNVRLLRANILRLVEEENKLRVYYHLDNSKEISENQSNFIEIARREAGCVEVLIRSYPEYVGVAQLPLKNKERKIGVVRALWERGLLMMEKSFK